MNQQDREDTYKKEYGLTPAEHGELNTNFDTIAETKVEIKKLCEAILDNLGDIYNVVQAIAKGADPEDEIKPERKYRYNEKEWPVNFNGLVARTENDLGVLIEYRNDINLMHGRGLKK